MSERDIEWLQLIQRMIGHLDRRLVGLPLELFMRDQDEQDLTAYRIAVIGEATNKLSPSLKARHERLPWAAIYKMRNVISHDYPGIDMTRVFETAANGLGDLARLVEAELGRRG